MKTLAAIIKVSIQTILFVFLPVVALTFITSRTDRVMGIRSFVVQTGSMEPTVPVGSIVFMQPAVSYAADEVITFKQGDRKVTHRIIEVVDKPEGIFYRTQGDANTTPDTELVSGKDIVGKGVFQIMYAGKFIAQLKTPQGFVAAIVAPTILFILLELWNIKQEIVRSTEKRMLAYMRQNGLLSEPKPLPWIEWQ